VDRIERDGDRLLVGSKYGVGVRWKGPANVNGRLWPVHDAETLWLPPGANRIEPAPKDGPVTVLDFNGGLKSARSLDNGVELSYQSSARAIAVLNVRPRTMELDGVRRDPAAIESGGKFVVTLPRGQHLVTLLSAHTL
jgi:hypothetical protein